MKKIFLTIMASVFVCNAAYADRVIILDDNNNIRQEVYTQSMGSQSQPVYVQSAPQPVVVTRPAPQPVVVVRQTRVPRTYYYDSAATALVAGFTGAVIGNAIFRGGHHHHHHHHHH